MNAKITLLLTALVFSSSGFSKQARMVFMTDKRTESVTVCGLKATVIQFPAKPSKSFVGNHGLFAVNYNENDVIITGLRSNAQSNLFVYLEGRRFGFNLRVSVSDCDEIVIVKDGEDGRIRLKVRNE